MPLTTRSHADMQFLVIGLGSMGQRRIRCLKTLGFDEITAFDLRHDRRDQARTRYDVETIERIADVPFDKIGAVIIATPPDKHNEFIKRAIDEGKPAFVEASVILQGLPELNDLAKENGVLIAPSCTMMFHPALKRIKAIVRSEQYGKVTDFCYYSGQYLPDWHPWENIRDFYVSKKETGGCREIVPFELTWIVDLLGFPTAVNGFYGKTFDFGVDIDDTYVFSMSFGSAYGSIMVDVVSRYAFRNLILNMEEAHLTWRWDEHLIRVYEPTNHRWIDYDLPKGAAEEGYNKNINEDPYIDEISSFIDALCGKSTFPNSLDDDIKVLSLLNKFEGEN